MTYAFILGRVYTLSLAELLQVLYNHNPNLRIVESSYEALIVDSDKALDVDRLQRQLGGIIKILKILDVVKKRDQDSINFALQNYFKPSKLKTDFLKGTTGKIQFGISIYLLDPTIRAFGEPKRLGMFIKRGMQDGGASIRLVLPEFNALTLASVVVTHNQLLQKGAEICIVAGVDKVYVGKTLTVQDFEDYGRRDYQRPVRDDQRGMIPPKVAQSMLNLCGVKPGTSTLLDPFCGIGTFVQEGALLGYRMVGTDVDKLAIAGSEKNLEWFRNRYKIPKGKYHLEVSDARSVSDFIAHLRQIKAITTVDAIVTEGTLGPIYGKLPSPVEMTKNFADLEELYRDCFSDFAKFLENKAKIVMCVPAYKRGQNEYIMFPSLDFATSNGYNIVSVIQKEFSSQMPFLRLSPRGTVIYDRKDQTVAREIVIFEKQ
jgi:tRNA G10  N-methylase Trm11